MINPTVCIMPVGLGDGNHYPRYMTAQSAGADCFAAIPHSVTLQPLQRLLIPLGFSIALPAHYEAQIRPRSGLALRLGVTVLNAPGTIDSDYRGEVGVILINLSDAPYTICPMDRVAQIVVAPVAQAMFVPGLIEPTSSRAGGFGSTGT